MSFNNNNKRVISYYSINLTSKITCIRIRLASFDSRTRPSRLTRLSRLSRLTRLTRLTHLTRLTRLTLLSRLSHLKRLSSCSLCCLKVKLIFMQHDYQFTYLCPIV